MKELRVKAKEEHRIKKGHYWLFSNELEKIDKTIKPGEIVRLLDCHDNILGYGFFNPHSLIAVRFITKSEEPPTKNFIFETSFKEKLSKFKRIEQGNSRFFIFDIFNSIKLGALF